MKSLLRIFFGAVLVMASFVSLVQAAPQSYPLVCKGGAGSSLRIIPYGDGTKLKFYFKKSPRGATSGLSKGTCAWLDRGISSNESNSLSMYFENIRPRVELIGGNANQRRYKIIHWGASNDLHFFKKVISAINSGAEFHLHAYNQPSRRLSNGRRLRGSLKATKFGP